MMRLFRNRPVRRAAAWLVCIALLLAALGTAVITEDTRAAAGDRLAETLALAGGIERNRPAREWSVLTGEIDPEDYAAGLRALAEFSYQDQPAENLAFYRETLSSRLTFFFVSLGVFFLAALVVLLWAMGRSYRGMRELTEVAKCVVRGEEPVFGAGEEGDEAAMRYAFSAMAERVRYSVDSLSEDKRFMKNLLSDISHQLKTPLSALRMYNEILLSRKELSEEKRTAFLTQSRELIDRTDWLVQGLLKMARVESGAVEMNLRPCYLLDTVDMAVLPLKEPAHRRGVTLVNDVPGDLMLRHDAEWVSEAVGNLIKNAVEHTPAGGRVRVSAEETPLTVALRVEDNGEGMASTEIPHIFERFYRKSGAANPGSVGIGLSLAKQIFELNGADVCVQSAPGAGSVFTVTFLKGTKDGKPVAGNLKKS